MNTAEDFIGRDEEWSNFACRWWRLCNKSDSGFVPDFYADWNSLANDIMTAAGTSMKDEKKRGLLQNGRFTCRIEPSSGQHV